LTTRYRMHVGEGYPQHLKAWFVELTVVLVEASLPQIADPDGLIREFGEPAARLDSTWGVMTVRGGLHVYPDRGIALFIGPESQVLRVSLFAPTNLDDFVRQRKRPTL
jgi:hypothetical protein